MSEWLQQLAGDDWEQYAGVLLRHRYDPIDVQPVPAANQGDLGLDFWIRGTGVVFQCYGPDPSASITERLRLHKKKLREELRKLRNNADQMAALIAPAVCTRYVFFVPKHDSRELLQYAADKAAQIRQDGLPFCGSDFQIVVQSLDDYAEEQAAVRSANIATPILQDAGIEAQTIVDWLAANDDMTTVIREKIEAAHPHMSPERVRSLIEVVAEDYLLCEDALNGLHTSFPEIYERIRRIVTERKRRLLSLGGSSAPAPSETIRQELDDLITALSDGSVGIDRSDAGILSRGAIATWLADCTLDTR